MVAAVIDAWGSRYNLNPDGISYVEMAQHALARGPHELINGLWSPGYPSLLMWPIELAAGRWDVLIPALHLINLFLYVMALGLFLQVLRASVRRDAPVVNEALVRHTVAAGSVLFASIVLVSIGLGLITPDFGVMFAVLASAACCFQLERARSSWSWAVALGLVLGLGYWVKGILLLLNVLLLALLILLPLRVDRARTKVLLAALVFGLVSLPLAVLVSARVGRPTVGEVGRLNYAWSIDHVTPFVGWLGDSSGRFGTPEHPPRVVQRQPLTLEFATPVRATYPLWFDPAYWYAGVKPRFDLGLQWRVLRDGVVDLGRLLLDQWILFVSLLALGLSTKRQATPSPGLRAPSVIGVWSLAAALVYAAVHVEPRYLAGFLLTGVITVWAWLSRRAPRRGLPWVMAATVLALALSLVRYMQLNIGGLDPAYRPDYLVDAAQLTRAGLSAGDPVATVGDAFEQYAAFAAATPITAQVIDSGGFWQLSPAARSALEERLAEVGVRAMLANNVESTMQAEGWRLMVHADSSNLGLLLLRHP